MIEWLKLRGQKSRTDGFYRWFTADGVRLSKAPFSAGDATKRATKIDRPDIDGLIAQIDDEGLLEADEAGYIVGWGDLYTLLESEDYGSCREILGIPDDSGLLPEIRSHNTLLDQNFSIFVSGWYDGSGLPAKSVTRAGGILSFAGKEMLAPKPIWDLCEEAEKFARRPEAERNEISQRKAWGRIRAKAKSAGAKLDQFLQQSVILTPDKLDLAFRKAEFAGERVIEVIPGFRDAPAGWLEKFDAGRSTQPYYQISSPAGITHIIIPDEVKVVLDQIKSLSGRRITGERAEAFLLNPVAALGDSAASVIDIDQFSKAREEANILFSSFTAHVVTGQSGDVTDIGLNILTASEGGVESETVLFEDDQEAEKFIALAQKAIAKGRKIIPWRDFEIEILPDTQEEIVHLMIAMAKKNRPRILVDYESVFDLSNYSDRVEGIGEEKFVFSPYISKLDSQSGWFPENVRPILSWLPEGSDVPVAVPVDKDVLAKISKAMAEAKSGGLDAFSVPGIEPKIPVMEAAIFTKTFESLFSDIDQGVIKRPGNPASAARKDGDSGEAVKNKHLILKTNISDKDYVEPAELKPGSSEPILPSSLNGTTKLKDHQLKGVAWLQNLFRQSPAACRGCILADDMGLGKTLQLLTIIASAIEEDNDIAPILIVAPVSLLENWQEEAVKFFKKHTFRTLVAYGDDLTALRAPKESVDAQLRAEGLVKFLKPGWVGNANLVLTTYETLRDLEFSFASEKWSIMVCDEAQKIKNPNAMMTRAAKKQNARFKIACTGTPVENSLVDLWCLFDFVQPGFLGSLNEFGAEYRKQIEARTDGEKAKTEELRSKIEPYILRRTKQEVAKDLPAKVSVPSRVLMSDYQRKFYIQAVSTLPKSDDKDSKGNGRQHLQVLHYLRMICADPRRFVQNSFIAKDLGIYKKESPKLGWLINKLKDIKAREEKAILFCEFKEIQRMLHHFVQTEFGISPSIINGDTSASSKNDDSRQKRIRSFQEQKGFGAIILSPVAVGFGVNIQAANHVIHYSRTWNPAKEDQATDRAYRIGQTRDVFVYCPTVYADDFVTFEVRLDELLERKRALAGDMLNGSGDIAMWEIFDQDMAPKESGATVYHRITGKDLSGMTGQSFEALSQAIWVKMGYHVLRQGGAGDGGIDLVAFRDGECLFMQCKATSNDEKSLGWEAVKDVAAGEGKGRLKFPGYITYRKLAITNQSFNTAAKEHAGINNVELVERDWISNFLDENVLTVKDILVSN